MGSPRRSEDVPRPSDGSVVVPAAVLTLRAALEETKRILVTRRRRGGRGKLGRGSARVGMARRNLHHMAARLGLRR